MKRRTALIGLATAAAGSAVAFGSGAFTSVRAERQVNIAVSNDSDAAVIIEANNSPPPGGSSSATSLGSATIDGLTTSNNGNQELDVPSDTVSVSAPLSQYAGEITRSNAADLVTENGGQITLNLDKAEFADGFNQGVVFFEDLLRIQNQSINDIELSATKKGDAASDFDLLFFDRTAGSNDTEGQVKSAFNSSGQFVGSNVGGLTPVIDSADATLDGTVDVVLEINLL